MISTEPSDVPAAFFAEIVPVMLTLPATGDFAGRVKAVMLAIDATAIGQSGILNEIGVLTIGIVRLQFAPHSGHDAVKGMIPSSLRSMSNVPPLIGAVSATE